MSRLDNVEITRILVETEAVRQGHFKLTSGRHSDTYIQCARILEHPRLTLSLAAETVNRLPEFLRDSIDIVASPAVGGILFGFAIAEALDKPMVFSERVDGKMTFRRAFEIPRGAKVLIAEDVVTSGGSVAEVIELVRASGGGPVAVVALFDRGGEVKFTEPFFPLLRRETPSWDPDECVLCQQGIAIDSPGSRSLGRG